MMSCVVLRCVGMCDDVLCCAGVWLCCRGDVVYGMVCCVMLYHVVMSYGDVSCCVVVLWYDVV